MFPLLSLWQLCWGARTHTRHNLILFTDGKVKCKLQLLFQLNYSVGLWSPLSVGEQLYRQEELPILLPLPSVTDGAHHGRVWLWLALYTLSSPQLRLPALHCHVSFIIFRSPVFKCDFSSVIIAPVNGKVLNLLVVLEEKPFLTNPLKFPLTVALPGWL